MLYHEGSCLDIDANIRETEPGDPEYNGNWVTYVKAGPPIYMIDGRVVSERDAFLWYEQYKAAKVQEGC